MATRDVASGGAGAAARFPGAGRDKLIRWFTLAAADKAFAQTSG